MHYSFDILIHREKEDQSYNRETAYTVNDLFEYISAANLIFAGRVSVHQAVEDSVSFSGIT